jgi:hypothetical protein
VEGALKWNWSKILFGTESWVGLLLDFLVAGAFFVVSRMVATTENTSDIIRAFRSVTVLCGVITCAFDASWFEMAVVLCVSVSLAVFALDSIPFVSVSYWTELQKVSYWRKLEREQ